MPEIKTTSQEQLINDFKEAVEQNNPMLLIMANRCPEKGLGYRFQMEQEKALINALTDTALVLNKSSEALAFIHRAKQILELSEKYIEHELSRRAKNN